MWRLLKFLIQSGRNWRRGNLNTDPRFSVLVVDDEKSNLAVLHRILSDEYRIFMAKTGEMALSLAEREKPDMILLDILLPDIDGFEVLVRLKENPSVKDIPVVCITGLGSEIDEAKGFRLGAVDYITKPFKRLIVLARVRTHMEIVRQMRAIEKLGLMDPLTNIPNRRSFDDRLEMEWRRAIREKTPLSFLMIDIDKFKNYNDAYGHPQGDLLLKEAAKIFSRRARRPADVPARLGGEEFGVLLPDTSHDAAMRLAEEIREDMETLQVPVEDGGEMTGATISVGVVTSIPDETSSSKVFIACADESLYAAKKAGRNQVISGGIIHEAN